MTTEGFEGHEDNSAPLDTKLRKLIEFFPPKPRTIEESHVLVERERSVILTPLLNKFESLLDSSVLGPNVRKLFVPLFIQYFRIGLDKENMEKEEFYHLLGLDSVTGGMSSPFEKERIERDVIRRRRSNKVTMYKDGKEIETDDIDLIAAEKEFLETWGKSALDNPKKLGPKDSPDSE